MNELLTRESYDEVIAEHGQVNLLFNNAGITYAKTFEGHTWRINCVAFSPDGRTVVSGSHDDTLKLWSVSSGKCIKTFKGHSHCVYSAAFSPDGRTVVSSSDDRTFKLWSVSSGDHALHLDSFLHNVV